jgi:hypothetical protein
MQSTASSGSFSDVVLVDELPAALVCSICQSCPFSPKQCRKGHLFCEVCITKWLGVEATCPLDRAPLLLADLSDNLLARNLISKLRVRCSNNGAGGNARDLNEGLEAKRVKLEEAGCGWVGPLEGLEAHRKECPCEVVPCVFAACGVRMQRAALSSHVETCRFAVRQCVQCAAQVERCRLDLHLASEVCVCVVSQEVFE